MMSRARHVTCGLVVAGLAACGSVEARPTDAASDATPDAWAMRCVPPATVTAIESAMAGYGNVCVHGSWTLQSPNGTTVPSTRDAHDHTTPVVPTPIGATQTPNTIDPSSTYAIHVSGVGQKNDPGGIGFSYAQLTASFNTLSATQIGAIDASAFLGIEFDGIIIAPSGARVSIANAFTDPSGMHCDPRPGMPMISCFDNPNKVLAPSTAWTTYRVAFKDLTQLGFGFPSPTGDQFPRDAIINVRWDIDIPSTTEAPAWELWIDNLKLYP